jgi:hypothetical protein
MRHESPHGLSRLSRCPQAVSRLSTSRSAGVVHQALGHRGHPTGKCRPSYRRRESRLERYRESSYPSLRFCLRKCSQNGKGGCPWLSGKRGSSSHMVATIAGRPPKPSKSRDVVLLINLRTSVQVIWHTFVPCVCPTDPEERRKLEIPSEYTGPNNFLPDSGPLRQIVSSKVSQIIRLTTGIGLVKTPTKSSPRRRCGSQPLWARAFEDPGSMT